MTYRQPYDYQREAINAAVANLSSNCIITIPTGGGKTVTAATLVRETGLRTLWLAERKELVNQAARELRTHGLDVGIVMAGRPSHPNRRVQVGSVQTVVRRQCGEFDLIVVDECHRSAGPQQEKLLTEDYTNTPRLGLTATPFRLDRKPLGNIFGNLIVAAYPDELVNRGIILEPRVYAPPPESLEGIKVANSGDYERGKLSQRMSKSKLVGDVVETWLQHAKGMKTALFACSVEHSQKLIAGFVAAGIPAEHIDGNTPTHHRDAAFKRLELGVTQILSNVSVFVEGWDMPSLECEIIARPTASLCLHLQMGGRVVRSSPGKSRCLILDHAGNFLRHGRLTRRLEYSLNSIVTPVEKDIALVVCSECHRVVSNARTHCPECGAELPHALKTRFAVPKREIPRTVAGQLQPFEDAMAELESIDNEKNEERQQFHREMLAIAAAKNYAPGWAAWRFKEKFGTWPAGSRSGVLV